MILLFSLSLPSFVLWQILRKLIPFQLFLANFLLPISRVLCSLQATQRILLFQRPTAFPSSSMVPSSSTFDSFFRNSIIISLKSTLDVYGCIVRYAKWMLLVGVVACAVCCSFLWIFFRTKIPDKFPLPNITTKGIIKDKFGISSFLQYTFLLIYQ